MLQNSKYPCFVIVEEWLQAVPEDQPRDSRILRFICVSSYLNAYS